MKFLMYENLFDVCGLAMHWMIKQTIFSRQDS